MPAFTERVRAPRAELSPFVESIRIGTATRLGMPRPVEHLPDGTATMLFRVVRDGSGDLSISGPRSIARYKQVGTIPLYVRIIFRPAGCSPLFHLPVAELADQVIELQHLWRGDALRLLERLLSTPDGDAAAMLLEAALIERVRRASSSQLRSHRLARAGVRRVATASGSSAPRVETIASELGVSARHLRRAFHEVVGVTPKQFARMSRLMGALGRASGRAATWSVIAAESGYCDQPHLIADARELLRMTPRAFLERDAARPLVSCCV